MIDEREHLAEIDQLRGLVKLAAELGPRMPALLDYLDELERRGVVTWRSTGHAFTPPDLSLCLDEERELARAFSAFAKVAIDVAKKQGERKGLPVEEWAWMLASTARST